mgnify:CR=1 FL=1
MRLSLAYEMQRPVVDDHAVVEETIEQCVLADKMGFDAVWFVEHHFLTSFSMSPCPEVMFGALSRLTKRIRLGFGVVILPYHHPVRVAERVAMVDHLSGGRVEFGTGRSAAYEQIGMGIDPRHTRAMWEESLAHDPEDLGGRRLLVGGPVLERAAARRAPKPYQKPHPRIWVAALQPATYQLAAEKGIGVMALSVAAPSYLDAAHQGVQGAGAPRQSGGQGHQRPVAEPRPWVSATPTTRRRASWPRSRCGPSSGRIARISRTRRISTSSSSRRGAACPSISRRTSRAISRRKAAPTVRPRWISPAAPGRSRSALWNQIDADTLVDRGVLVAGNPETLPSQHRHSRGGRRGRATVPHGHRDGAPRQGDVVHRDVRPARHS